MAFFSLCFFLSRNRKEKIMFLFIFQSIRRLFDGYYCQQEHEQISQKKCDLFVSGSGDEREQTKANNFKLNLSNFHATKMMWNLLRADLWHSIFLIHYNFLAICQTHRFQPLCRLSCRRFVHFFQNIFEIYGTNLTVDTNIIHVATTKTQRAKVCRRRNHLGHTCVRPTQQRMPLLHFNL